MAKKQKKQKEKDAPVKPEVVEEPVAGEEETPVEVEIETEASAGEEEAEPGPEQLIAEAQAEATKNWDLYLRERADLENFRKRSQREKEDAIRFANDRLLKEMIPVLDNLERAVEHAGEETGTEGLLEGVNMTMEMFRKTLEASGVKPIDAIGTPFDPNLHQAMGQVETEEHPPNSVAAEFQKGYLLNDRLLRPSLVMVAKAPAAPTDAADNTEEQE